MAVHVQADTEASRPYDVRRANDRLARTAERMRFVARAPMLCECSDASCDELFLIPLERYRRIRVDSRLFLTAPRHRLAGAELDREEREFWVQRAG